MDSTETSIRILQGVCREAIGNYIGIPQGIYLEIHGNSIGILQGLLKRIRQGIYKETMRKYLRVLWWFLRNVYRDSLMNPTGVLKGS